MMLLCLLLLVMVDNIMVNLGHFRVFVGNLEKNDKQLHNIVGNYFCKVRQLSSNDRQLITNSRQLGINGRQFTIFIGNCTSIVGN